MLNINADDEIELVLFIIFVFIAIAVIITHIFLSPKNPLTNPAFSQNHSLVGALKNEELFTMDVIPNESAKQKFRRELEEKKAKKVKKLSIFEERKIKKMINN